MLLKLTQTAGAGCSLFSLICIRNTLKIAMELSAQPASIPLLPLLVLLVALSAAANSPFEMFAEHPFSRIALHRAFVEVDHSASISASPTLLGLKGENAEWVTVTFNRTVASSMDWIAVFSPARFNESVCVDGNASNESPFLCTAPIKYQYANFTSLDYEHTGRGLLHFRLINQRADFAFGYFSGGISNPVLLAVSMPITFKNPKGPAYPRLALGRSWNEMVVTWTSGYGIHDAIPLVKWGTEDHHSTFMVSAGTLTYEKDSLCGPPANSVGWREPGFFHTSFLTDLWPNVM